MTGMTVTCSWLQLQMDKPRSAAALPFISSFQNLFIEFSRVVCRLLLCIGESLFLQVTHFAENAKCRMLELGSVLKTTARVFAQTHGFGWVAFPRCALTFFHTSCPLPALISPSEKAVPTRIRRRCRTADGQILDTASLSMAVNLTSQLPQMPQESLPSEMLLLNLSVH